MLNLTPDVKGLPCVKAEYGPISFVGGAAPVEGETVIVSTIVAPRLKEARPDLTVLVPDTGPTCVRDENGRIIAVRRFICY